MPTLSLIVPTHNEAANVSNLAAVLAATLADIDYELLFIDDSSDETPALLATLAASNPRLHYLHRSERGLGSAVVAGFALARSPILAVMDANFQHPPALLLPMLAAIDGGADLVIPSRFLPGGSDGGLSLPRKTISFVARHLGQAVLRSLRPISDPTGGLFMLRAQVLAGIRFRPLSWKILTDILVRGHYLQVTEFPYSFSPRAAGTSKLTARESLNYLLHLFHLVLDSPNDRRFFLFALVGSSGFLVDIGLYGLALRLTAPVVLSGFFSALCAMIWNFTWNDLVTWRTNHHVHISLRALKYALVSLVGIGISTATLAFTYQLLHFHPLLAKLLGIILAVTWNYLLNSRWTWRPEVTAAVCVTRVLL